MMAKPGLLARMLLVLFLALGAAGLWANQTRAAQTLCTAEVTLTNGSKMKVGHASIMESSTGSFVSRTLLARRGDEIVTIYLDRVRSLKRGVQVKNIDGEPFIEFAYELQNGNQGAFWLKGRSQLAGRTDLGFATVPLKDVESVLLNCPPPTDYSTPRREMH